MFPKKFGGYLSIIIIGFNLNVSLIASFGLSGVIVSEYCDGCVGAGAGAGAAGAGAGAGAGAAGAAGAATTGAATTGAGAGAEAGVVFFCFIFNSIHMSFIIILCELNTSHAHLSSHSNKVEWSSRDWWSESFIKLKIDNEFGVYTSNTHFLLFPSNLNGILFSPIYRALLGIYNLVD